jgi:putative glycosyltransferase (TIGR04348 family)
MRILVVTPVPSDSTRGNRITAVRWASLFREAGYDVDLREAYAMGRYDALVALHARRSFPSICRFRQANPDSPVIVCLTGTDLHLDFDPARAHSSNPQHRENYRVVCQSLALADRIVLLEPVGLRKLPESVREKCHVIRQSAACVTDPPSPPDDIFLVTVIGHLRAVKDPFRTAEAVRGLPASSRIRVRHIGMALDDRMREQAQQESLHNPRYEWLGPLPHEETLRQLAQSHVTVLSSRHEGAPGIISEAIVHGVPIVASRIDATEGLLGSSYPGLFEFGDTQALCELLRRAETEREFYEVLRAEVRQLAPQFSRQQERQAWKSLWQITFGDDPSEACPGEG